MRWKLAAVLLLAGITCAGSAHSAGSPGPRKDPAAAHATFLQAREQERTGNDAAALDLYKRAFRLDDRNRDLCFLYLDRLKASGSLDSAYALGNRCAALPGKPSLSEYKTLGELALRTDDAAAALRLYREAYALDEDDGDVLYVLAGLYEDAQDWKGYAEVVDALLPRLGYPSALMERQLRVYARLDRQEAAVSLLKDAWRETGRLSYGLALASYYEGRGLHQSLLAVARTLAVPVDSAPPVPEYEWLLARAYAGAERPDSALLVCEQLLKNGLTDNSKSDSGNDSESDFESDLNAETVHYFHANLLFDRGRYAGAYGEARTLAQGHPGVSGFLYLQGSAALELRKPEARVLLEKAAALAPLSPDYRTRLAYADYVFGTSKDSLRLLAQASKRLTYAVTDSISPSQALLLEGFAHGQLARTLDPREAWERPAVLTDSNAARRHRLQAVARFEKFLAADSGAARSTTGQRAALFELASHLDKLGERPRARELLRRLIGEDSTQAMALNYLGYMLVENLPVDSAALTEAGSLLERAVALEPENGAYLDSRGWYFYRAGSLDSAGIYLGRAAESMPSDPSILGHRCEVLHALQRQNRQYQDLQYQDLVPLCPDVAKVPSSKSKR